MTHLATFRATHLVKLLGALAWLSIAVGCASTPPPPPPADENLLSAAGFKMIEATTVEQREHLQELTPGKFREMQRTGVHYYIYPDAAKDRIFVGTTKQYAAYLRLHPNNNENLPAELNAQIAADQASMVKQDKGMQANDQRDLSDPWFYWPSFAEIIW
jgi:hypothetical protein